jgi:hypothetical protein
MFNPANELPPKKKQTVESCFTKTQKATPTGRGFLSFSKGT